MFKNYKNILFFILAVIFFGLAVIGGMRSYSTVPFWDMVNGYLNFFTRVSNGDWSAWWAQHNEHRIVLSRIFFWLDLKFFNGQGWFLIATNYVLLMLICGLFYKIWKRIEPSNQYSWLGYFLISWLFWWIQRENLQWGFQSQFFLAQLLPLLGFYLLHLAYIDGPKKSRYFFLSVLIGVLAIGTMANGILALPLMVIFAILIKMNWRRVLLISSFAVTSLALYFYDYQSNPGHGSLLQEVLEDPIGLLYYITLYLGGPFSFGSTSIGLWTSSLAGTFLIISSIFIAFRTLYSKKIDSLQLMLLLFILYIGGTALATAGGRLLFGVDQALSSRYMTPSLMAWVALFLLLYINLNFLRTYAKAKLWRWLFLLLILMLPEQLTALKSKNAKLYERDLAGLALELGIQDQSQIGNVYPGAKSALNYVKIPVEKNWSIFGSYPLVDLREKVGQAFNSSNHLWRECIGYIDEVSNIKTDTFLKVRGWIFHEDSNQTEGLIAFVGSDNQIQGYGLTGHERLDVTNTITEKASHAGFKGYIRASEQGKDLYIYHYSMNCKMRVEIPRLLFKVVESNKLSIKPTVNESSVTGINDWVGGDYNKSNFLNLRVLGSYINSDSDIGSVTLKMRRGDKLYYRSGPTEGRQTIQLNNNHDTQTILPLSKNWQLLEFSGEHLPETFTLKFTDNGDGWGEWSAVGLNKKSIWRIK